MENNIIDELFDDLLFQTIRGGLSHQQIEAGRRREEFRQVKEWQSRYGYKFNIYPNDHLIEGKKHFHLDHDASNVHCKLDFDGNVLDQKGNNAIPPNIMKDLVYFLKKELIIVKINEMWDTLNPTIKAL